MIGKIETMKEDTGYILNKIGLESVGENLQKSSGGSTETLAEEYFKQLDSDTITKLYNMYAMDFIMFGYQPDQLIG